MASPVSIRLAQGREASKKFIKDNPELFKEIRPKGLDLKLSQPVQAGAPPAEAEEE